MCNKIIIRTYSSPYGELILGSYRNELCICDWKYRKMRQAIDKRISTALEAEFSEGKSEVIEDTIVQLKEYFAQKREKFDIPLRLLGTDFQKKVWEQLQEISYGETQSYLELSKSISNEKAIRAVAGANGANAISILIPCHRIIGSDGKLVGYAGGIETKKKLLKLEGALRDSQMSLF